MTKLKEEIKNKILRMRELLKKNAPFVYEQYKSLKLNREEIKK